MAIEWGTPKNPAQLRFNTGTESSGPDGNRQIHRKWFVHRVSKMYGFTIGMNLFFGLIVLDDQRDVRERIK